MPSGLIGKETRLRELSGKLNQIEIYRANLLALDVYRREPLNGRLRALEIFETTRPGIVNVRDRIDWQALWERANQKSQSAGKEIPGICSSGENARVLGALLAQDCIWHFMHLNGIARRPVDLLKERRP